MNIAVIVPGGVGQHDEKSIPVLHDVIGRLSARHNVFVFALFQEDDRQEYSLGQARIRTIPKSFRRSRALLDVLSVHRHMRFDVVQAFWAGPAGALAVVAGRGLRIPSVVHIAGGELISLPDIEYGGQLTRARRAQTWLALRASAVTASTPDTMRAAARLGIRAQPLVLGVDLARWPVRAPKPAEPPYRLLHVGDLNRVKDQPTLLRALVTLRNLNVPFTVDIVGVDTLNGEIQRLAEQLGLQDHVTFHGHVPPREVRGFMEQAHLLVHSSRHEAAEMVTMEAALVGVPTVGTRVGRVAAWAPDAAVAVGVQDHEELSMAILDLLQDDSRRQRIATAAQALAVSTDVKHSVSQLEEVYRRLVKPRPVSAKSPVP